VEIENINLLPGNQQKIYQEIYSKICLHRTHKTFGTSFCVPNKHLTC